MTTFLPPENFGVNLVRNTPQGDLHARRHMDLCRSIDMTKLSIILGDMVATGFLSPHQMEAFHAQAQGLLNTMLAENHRSFIGSPNQSTAEKIRTYGVTRTEPLSAGKSQ